MVHSDRDRWKVRCVITLANTSIQSTAALEKKVESSPSFEKESGRKKIGVEKGSRWSLMKFEFDLWKGCRGKMHVVQNGTEHGPSFSFVDVADCDSMGKVTLCMKKTTRGSATMGNLTNSIPAQCLAKKQREHVVSLVGYRGE